MDIAAVDDMLMNSFGMSDLGNIDIDKYQKEIFSPSPKSSNITTVSPGPGSSIASPQKSISPHVVPNYAHHHQQPQRHPQQARNAPNMQQFHNQQPQIPPPQLQRKINLGPHFDRLGILNQANEVPPMTAPFFAKALQQHGGTTLGAILQAHQHALQQQMQRENFMLQQAAQQQLFQQQGFPINQLYQQQQQQQAQRMNPLLLERRADDQIVPNPQILPPQEAWLQQHGLPHFQLNKHFRIKREVEDEMTNTRATGRKSKAKRPRKENYVIFNDDSSRGSDILASGDDEEDKLLNPPIQPPKNSVFVRYKSESNKSLPSFHQTFSNHIDKIKKRDITKSSNSYANETQNKDNELFFTNTDFQIPEELPKVKQESSDLPKHEKSNIEKRRKDSKREKHKHSSTKENKNNESTPSYSYLDFLNDVGKDHKEDFPYEGEHQDNTNSEISNTSSDTKNTSSTSLESLLDENEKKEVKEANDAIAMFSNELDLNNDHNYDNLFNGNSDEHYFQAFKENNLHLMQNDLNENKVSTGDDVLKLLHSPLDFLNEKFLK